MSYGGHVDDLLAKRMSKDEGENSHFSGSGDLNLSQGLPVGVHSFRNIESMRPIETMVKVIQYTALSISSIMHLVLSRWYHIK